ncbi:proteinaceous RNase P 3-like [Tasmannia lanceolata]|uniref:proteinaceous RNase P 3-like n=1 Tax=Tasmannia lanceolata TaxID=3420 RepID=UPI004063839A
MKKNWNLLENLTRCELDKDFPTALSFYKDAVSKNIHLNHRHFNILLSLCATCLCDPKAKPIDNSLRSDIHRIGYKIFNHMLASNIKPTEADMTPLVVIAATRKKGDIAFRLVKDMRFYNLCPTLSSCRIPLSFFCENLEVDKAYSVEEYMVSMGVKLEEKEIVALLEISALYERAEKVYSYLQKLRESVSCVSETTAQILKNWFSLKSASKMGKLDWDVGLVKEAVLKNGGGWHGLGWLGKGKWKFSRSRVGSDGSCSGCKEILVDVDIDLAETEKLAELIASLSFDKEITATFRNFQEWLHNHNLYDSVVDGKNAGHSEYGGFRPSKLILVVKELYNKNKSPLAILDDQHLREVSKAFPAFLNQWRDQQLFHSAPNGASDWFCLYAAVKRKCLIVTNDSINSNPKFLILGNNFFLKWKEQYQVRFSIVDAAAKLKMPPPFSSVIQMASKLN